VAATHSRTSHRVVVALLDGKRERGFVYNFSPNAPSFNLFPSESADPRFASLVELRNAKAMFFVRTYEGNRARREAGRKAPVDPKKFRVRGHKMKITFNDGEEMFASSENYNPTRLGFFVYPLDPESNNLRIFVVNENVRQVTTGAAIDTQGRPPVTQARLAKPPAAPAPPPPPAAAADACAVPLESRVEAVLRMVAGESAMEVSEDTGVPTGVLSHWAKVFLQYGKAGLGGSLPDGPDGRDDLIKELAARVCTLEDEMARLRRAGGKTP
jgi:hypothetical protein